MHQNKHIASVFAFLLLTAGLIFATPSVTAQQTTPTQPLNYTLLERIPGMEGAGSNLKDYVQGIYNTALVILVLAAVLMISIGGFLYLTSAGNTSSMGNAKGIITDAIIGLVIALIAVLVMRVINPDLGNVPLPYITPTQVTPSNNSSIAPATGPGGTQTAPSNDDRTLATQILGMGILAASGDCSNANGPVSPQSNMTSMSQGRLMAMCAGCGKIGYEGPNACTDEGEGVRADTKMLQAIVAVRNAGHSFTITSIAGGNHRDGSDHYNGKAIDIAPATQALFDAFIANGAKRSSLCEDRNGKNVGCSPGSGADHIHIAFP